MRFFLKIFPIFILPLFITLSCTTPYKSSGFKGGFTETRLSENIFQVRFNSNAYTSTDRTSKYLMRRCAELTLEQGKQYFSINNNFLSSENKGINGRSFSFPSGQATIKLLDSERSVDMALDAIIIIEETNYLAQGRLSLKAKQTIQTLKVEKEDLSKDPIILNEKILNGKIVLYTNLSRVKKKPINILLEQQKLGVLKSNYPYPKIPKVFAEGNTISKELPLGKYSITIDSERGKDKTEIEVNPGETRVFSLIKIGRKYHLRLVGTLKDL